jgi:hypothetical protein
MERIFSHPEHSAKVRSREIIFGETPEQQGTSSLMDTTSSPLPLPVGTRSVPASSTTSAFTLESASLPESVSLSMASASHVLGAHSDPSSPRQEPPSGLSGVRPAKSRKSVAPIYLLKMIADIDVTRQINPGQSVYEAVDNMLSHAYFTALVVLWPGLQQEAMLRIARHARHLFHTSHRARLLEPGMIALCLYIACRSERKHSYMPVTPNMISRQFNIDPTFIMMAEIQVIFSPEAAKHKLWHPAPSEFAFFMLKKLGLPDRICHVLQTILKETELNYFGCISPAALIYFTTHFVLNAYVHPSQCPQKAELLQSLANTLHFNPTLENMPKFLQSVLVHSLVEKYGLHKPLENH